MSRIIDKPLYKYFSNVEYALNTIENSQIHLENPSKYNDVFDSATVVNEKRIRRLRGNTSSMVQWIYNVLDIDACNYLKEIKILDACTDGMEYGTIIDIVVNSLKQKYLDFTSDELFKRLSLFLGGDNNLVYAKNIKISCFSENKQSLLMWGYYAGAHTGLCIEFKFDEVPPEYQQIVKSLTKIDYTDYFNDNDQSFNNYFTKSRQWEHEQEWRIVCDLEKEGYIKFPFVSGIYLGCRMDKQNINIFLDAGKKYGIPVYSAVTSKMKYEIEFKAINVLA